MKRKSVIIGFSILLTMVFGITSIFGVTLEEVNNEISNNQNLLNEGRAEEQTLINEINTIETRMAQTQIDINAKEAEIASTQAEITAKNEELEEKSGEVEESVDGLNGRLRNMYKNGSIGFLEILLSSNDVSELISNLDLVQEVYNSDKDLVTSLQGEFDTIQETKDALVALEASLETQKAELDSSKESLEADKATLEEKKTVVSGNNAQIEENLASLNAQAAEIQSIINSSDEYDPGSGDSGSSSGDSGSSSGGSSGGGTLSWPVAGYSYVSSPWGWRYSPLTGTSEKHTGIDIPAPVGTPILAAANGVVIASYYNSSYGNMIIISHGNGLWTLYAHNSALYVGVGQVVSRGQNIAAMGSTGDSTGSHCHFEVRTSKYWGSDVNPYNYL